LYLREILSWLLEDDNPSVRYFTLVNILDKPEDDKEVIEAKRAIMEQDNVKRMLLHQNPDGSFLSKEMIDEYGEARARTGYQPKYKGTIWQAIFLAQLGADGKDERIKKLGYFILNANYHLDYKVFGIYLQHKYSLDFAAIPCFVSNMIWSLSKLGFYKDERLQDSIKWLLKYQRFDEGDFKTPEQWPYHGNRDRCFGRHSCFVGCTQALKAMTIIPKEDRNQQIEDFIKQAIDFVLLHRVYKRSRGNDKPIRREYELLTFPLTYYDDVLGILETLLFFRLKDKVIDDAVNFVLGKKNENGRWLLEKTVSGSSIYSKFEEVGKESKWITYRVHNILNKYNKTTTGCFSKFEKERNE